MKKVTEIQWIAITVMLLTGCYGTVLWLVNFR